MELLGHYVVNGNIFQNKIEAVLSAQTNLADVKWYFYDEKFQNFNWLNEPPLSIDTYYKLRAKQIREQYDYVVLRCSGGADSTNVLYSFLNNDIFPDEIVFEAPLSGLKNWQWNDVDTRMINTVSEFKFAQEPLFNEIRSKYSKVKTTHIDSFNRIVNPSPYEWLINCNDGIDPHASHEGTMYEHRDLLKLAESGKTIAIVTGTDKPYVFVNNNQVFTTFVDLPLNYLKRPFKEKFNNVHRVPFYWTPEFPEIISKMSHIIGQKIVGKNKDFNIIAAMIAKKNILTTAAINVELNSLADYLTNSRTTYTLGVNTAYNPNNVYGRGICPYIYPSTYNPKIFQAEKQNASQTFFGSQQSWFSTLHGSSRAFEIYKSDFINVYKKINKKYLNNTLTGFKYFEKYYSLGHVENFIRN